MSARTLMGQMQAEGGTFDFVGSSTVVTHEHEDGMDLPSGEHVAPVYETTITTQEGIWYVSVSWGGDRPAQAHLRTVEQVERGEFRGHFSPYEEGA